MKTRLTWLLILMLALTAFWGCSDDDDDPITPSQTAFEVMAAAGAAYVNSSDCPGVISAASLHDNLDLYTVIDIRSESDYLLGHIPGAYHSSLGGILTDLGSGAIPTDKPYVVACYSGQSAGHAKIAMELMGYGDVKSLSFGMSSWNSTLDRWTANCGNSLTTAETTPHTPDTTYDFPSPLGDDVEACVNAMLAGGFKGIGYSTIADNLDNYFIINYFSEADYLGQGTSGVPGHIPGSYQFTPAASLGIDQMLEYLPTDVPIVVYCWTSQTSSQIAAYLNMLGYDAYSLSFGSNALFYDSLTAHKWGGSADYELETGATATEPFATIAASLIDYVNDGTDCPGVISASSLHDNLDLYTVIDIRSEAAYLAGHIPGAYHSSLSGILDDVADGTIPSGKPYVITCYTGQSAGHAKIAMEMMGYDDVKSLGFGMSSWNSATDSWTANIGDNLGLAETTNNNANLTAHAYPTLDASATLESRVAAMIAGGFKGIDYSTVADNMENYFILNYFGQADYEGTGSAGVPGHIPGAFQFTPYASMGVGQMLANIPTDVPVVVYCWTGQHSSQITAYLNMLGYDAYSLKFGSNGLFHTNLTAHKWVESADYELESGGTPTEAFNTIATALIDYVNDSADCPGVISAQALYDNLDLYTVIDIRSADSYNAGHIAGAYHSSLASLLTDVGSTIPTDKPLVVACYSGQSAGHAKIALEMSGYEDVKTLGFGMSSWNVATDSWSARTGNALANPETTNNNNSLSGYAYPTLEGETLAGRVDAMLAAGFKGKSFADIEDYLDNYFIINYFGEADYEGTGTAGVPGHIPGAFQFTPYASMGVGQMLGNIPTDMPVIVYCWTGQHSSQITAYLNMLGYEAYSLSFGSNSLFYDDLTAHKWTASLDLPLVATPTVAAN